jgi:hypothetical protein
MKLRTVQQVLLAIFGATVIFIALLHILFGPRVIPGSVPVNATMDSEDRFYATMFLGFGVALLWCVREVQRKAALVYFLMGLFFLGGVARLVSLAAAGRPHEFFVAMTVLELTLPFLYVYLQYRVSGSRWLAG